MAHQPRMASRRAWARRVWTSKSPSRVGGHHTSGMVEAMRWAYWSRPEAMRLAMRGFSAWPISGRGTTMSPR
jgi:hypothetical protein